MAVRDQFASKSEVKRLNDFMALVVMVLLVGFVLLLTTVVGIVVTLMWDEHNQINEQNKILVEIQGKLDK